MEVIRIVKLLARLGRKEGVGRVIPNQITTIPRSADEVRTVQ